jgi:hypothetical protein
MAASGPSGCRQAAFVNNRNVPLASDGPRFLTSSRHLLPRSRRFTSLARGHADFSQRGPQQPWEDNSSERLAFPRVPGVIIGVNAGYAFSSIREANRSPLGGRAGRWPQFSSCDFFPRAMAAIARGHRRSLAESLAPSTVPDVSDSVIA